PIIDMITEIKPDVPGSAEVPYEISDADVARAEILGFAPTPVPPPTTVVTSLKDLVALGDSGIHSRGRGRRKEKIDWQGSLSWQRDVLFVLAPLFLIWFVLTASSFITHSVAWATLALGILIYGAGKIAIILNAAEEGMVSGILCLVPFYTPWYFL